MIIEVAAHRITEERTMVAEDPDYIVLKNSF